MLYGQNLPWRIALRQSSQCSASRLRSSSRAVNSVSSRCYYLSNARLPPYTSHRIAPVYTTRQFSSSLQRWKEKPASEGEKATEEQVVDETDSVDPSEDQAKKEKAVDFKSKAPEPIPNPQASDGKGTGASGSGGESGSGAGGSGDGGGSSKKRKQSERALQKPMVPEVYPQVMALPIAKRPLFPGFYKAITIRNPNVTAAIYEAVKRGQPYVGAFLLKDENADKDVIESMDDAYEVGTFCQVTSAFAGQGDEGGMTAVLYPHRRIKMSSLIPPSSAGETAKIDAQVVEDALEGKQEKDQEQPQEEKKGDVVASFEEGSSEAQQKPEARNDQKQQQQYEPTSFLQKYNVSLVNVDNLAEEPYEKKSATIRALIGEIVNVFKEIASMNHIFRDQISTFSMSQNAGNVGDDPAKLADFAAAVSAGEPHELQDALEALNMEDRLHKALLVLKKELMNAQLQSKISRDVEDKIQKRQREYWLMEQMKGIRRELGLESDGKDKLIENFKEKANKLAMPEGVKKVFDEELNKLAHLETAASEFNVTRNYLDWLTQIPWGQRSPENFGIQHAMTVLDEDHHGLKDVKDRILEFIAVGKLRGTVEGKILCMVGPPGVGKTSIGKSIARALNRQYYRFSVGGLADVAEIKGHRRTYVGALPGRIIQALKKCQTENPLILIDEVDKLGRGHQGDPASALLELLDPEQNNSFLDHYMDVPVDLSKVLFVCTANMTDTIPRPLLDRMEMIELSGYVADEKMAIAERYLAPSAKELTGLKDVDVLLEKEAITELINKYCRESGVRNLKKQIEKVYRKAALKIIKDIGEENTLSESKALTEEGKAAQAEAEKQSEETTDPKETPENIEEATTEKPRVALNVPSDVHVRIDTTNLKDYVGSPIFTSDRLYDLTPPGVAMGLAWTSMGGAALYVESILQSGLASSRSPHMQQTGNLKPVMKESSYIAYSFAQSFLAREFPGNRFFELAKIHLHCPEGAVPKDGPSAGITMASSMLSLALNEGVREDVAMTGELTVTGKVLRIGGLREKVVAARRAGAKVVVFPRDNWSDWLELPENIKEGIEGKPVDWYADVFDTLFSNIDRDKANTLWKKEIAMAEKKPARRSKRLKDVEEEEEEDDEADEI